DVAPRLVVSAYGHELFARAHGGLLSIDSGARGAVPGRRKLDRVPEPGACVPATRRGRVGRCGRGRRRDRSGRRGDLIAFTEAEGRDEREGENGRRADRVKDVPPGLHQRRLLSWRGPPALARRQLNIVEVAYEEMHKVLVWISHARLRSFASAPATGRRSRSPFRGGHRGHPRFPPERGRGSSARRRSLVAVR